MPERTSDGQWKWGNVKRKSRKELSQTVYGIWKGTGSKGSFHNFYHYGNGFRTSKKNKLKKECYQLNPLLESYHDKPLFDDVTIDDVKDIYTRFKHTVDDPNISKKYRKNLMDKYWKLRLLRVKMRRKAITKVPIRTIYFITGTNFYGN